jgi:two-component system, LytTR family, response regulator LytT
MKVAIVEDEPAIARRIERLTRDILDDRVQSVVSFRTLEDAEEALAVSPIDVLLLDLNVSGQDGFQLLRRAVSQSFHTIVISANTDRAMEAFHLGVIDYLGKPFTRDRLSRALDRVTGAAPCTPSPRVLAIRKREGIVLVQTADVLFAKAAGPYTELHLRNGAAELHTKSLEAMMTVLPDAFQRVHRSYIVRLSEIDRLIAREGTRYEIHLRSGQRIPVGRTRHRQLREQLARRVILP